jgi:hypothetical protein
MDGVNLTTIEKNTLRKSRLSGVDVCRNTDVSDFRNFPFFSHNYPFSLNLGFIKFNKTSGVTLKLPESKGFIEEITINDS